MTTMEPNRHDDLIARAAAVGTAIAPHAARHDAEGTFVSEAMDCLRDAGLLALAVPVELGGSGATIRQVAMVQRELAHHCGSTALATSMHQHAVSFTAWRYRRGLPGAEPVLRRIAAEGAVVVTTGGADFNRPRGEAKKWTGAIGSRVARSSPASPRTGRCCRPCSASTIPSRAAAC